MKKKICATVLVLALLVLVHIAGADSSVWKIVKGDNQLFIGGTVHFLTPSDYPLPDAFERAYRQSSILVFETDINKMQTPEFQQMLLTRVRYADGRNLRDVLSGPTFQQLTSHVMSRGIPIENLLAFKPGMVVTTLTVIELQRLGLSGTGVDAFFSSRALNDGKTIAQLETVEEQVTFLATMGDGQEDEMIAYALGEIRNLSDVVQTIKLAWRNGDRRKLQAAAVQPLQKDFPKVYEALIVKRNKAWVPKIESMLKTRDIEFVLVGAAHLVGQDGVLTRLEVLGYDIEQL